MSDVGGFCVTKQEQAGFPDLWMNPNDYLNIRKQSILNFRWVLIDTLYKCIWLHKLFFARNSIIAWLWHCWGNKIRCLDASMEPKFPACWHWKWRDFCLLIAASCDIPLPRIRWGSRDSTWPKVLKPHSHRPLAASCLHLQCALEAGASFWKDRINWVTFNSSFACLVWTPRLPDASNLT